MVASSSRYWGIPLLVALLLGLGSHPAQGQRDQQVFFRLSRIETDVRSLQSQINQLDRQIGRLQRLDGVEVEERSRVVPPSEPAPTYDQLATLVIETRQDMFALQERLAQLEAQLDLQSEP
ncbi:MAG: hypothetical protein ACFB4J_19900 [Elainellaceae cyanobacterium]